MTERADATTSVSTVPAAMRSSRRAKWALASRPAVDAGIWLVALYAGALLRLDFAVTRLDGFEVAVLVPFAWASQWLFGYWSGMYRGRWILGSFDEVAAVVRSTCFVTGVLFVVDLIIAERRPAPLSSVVAAGIIAFVGLGAVRYLARRALDRDRRARIADGTRAIVFGAGDGGQRTIRAMLFDGESPFVPVAILDDDVAKRHLSIHGVRVVGDRTAMARAAKEHDASVLVIAIPCGEGALLRELTELARDAELETRVLPSVRELFDGRVTVGDIRVPTETDLLGRRKIDIDLETVADYLHGKRVAVTGAGGSIGSELCRQISNLGPSRLVMIDRDECGLHDVQLTLEGRALLDSPDLVLADVRDRHRVAAVFRDVRPQVVFHAAALKHLPLLEAHPHEALKTNVWGTLSVLEAAADVGVERFVNVSTDKAANPCNALGYSKRITEVLTAHFGKESGVFLSVRFGNVLGSRGSVLVSFRRQLEAGGPLTVTHPDVTRFFMTVEEAVELVVQGGAIGRPGEVLVLDMGQPVRIADVARQLATTRSPQVPIVFTGLRPGEKLHEQLFYDGERVRPGPHPLIRHASVPPLDPAIIRVIDPSLSSAEMLETLRLLATEIDVRDEVGVDLVESEWAPGSSRIS
jgi:FlaA1/EpsC-like NDP-sugar epimerase